METGLFLSERPWVHGTCPSARDALMKDPTSHTLLTHQASHSVLALYNKFIEIRSVFWEWLDFCKEKKNGHVSKPGLKEITLRVLSWHWMGQWCKIFDTVLGECQVGTPYEMLMLAIVRVFAVEQQKPLKNAFVLFVFDEVLNVGRF